MNARKFIAASSREALQLVRAELGAEAVILSNRKVQDGVEIVAMAGSELAHLNETRMQVQHAEQTRSAPRPRAAATLSGRALDQAATLGAKVLAAEGARVTPARVETPQANHAAQQLMHELQTMHDTMQAQMAGMAWSTLQQQDPQRSGLLRELVNAGFSPALSRLLLDRMPRGADIDWVKRILAHNLRVATAREDVVARGGVYALVGPPGSAKPPPPPSWRRARWCATARTRWRWSPPTATASALSSNCASTPRFSASACMRCAMRTICN